jgi:alkylhydroperoxidase family enzyme
MPFLPDLPPEDFTENLRYAVTSETGEICRTFNIFHKLAHSPAVFTIVSEATAATLSDLKLDPILRELAICTVTRLTEATYPYHRHILRAKSLGVDETKLLALPVYKTHPAFGEEERVVMAFAEQLTEHAHASPELKARLAQVLGYQERVELAWTIGFYNAVARLTSACEVEVESEIPEGNALRR